LPLSERQEKGQKRGKIRPRAAFCVLRKGERQRKEESKGERGKRKEERGKRKEER
jgi:hypothetical protein